jgi:hypothetical protein
MVEISKELYDLLSSQNSHATNSYILQFGLRLRDRSATRPLETRFIVERPAD